MKKKENVIAKTRNKLLILTLKEFLFEVKIWNGFFYTKDLYI